MECGHRRAIHLQREEILKAIRLLLGVAYVQPKNVIAAGGGKGSFSTGLSDLTEWRMYSRLRVDGNRFEEPTPICVALCSLSGKRWARKVAAIWTSRIEQGGGAGGGPSG
jgi:hypothetical protein